MTEQGKELISGEGPQYRFPKGIELPNPPAGMEITKFHGEVRLFTARETGEPVNKAGFTERQVQDLLNMESERLANVREELAQEVGMLS